MLGVFGPAVLTNATGGGGGVAWFAHIGEAERNPALHVIGVVMPRRGPTARGMEQITQEVPRDAWRSYFDHLSRGLATVEATLEVDGPGIGAQIEVEHLALTGVTYDGGDDILVIGLDAPGGDPEELERVIDHPQRIFVEGEFPKDGMAIAIEDAERNRTIVTLERPPELPPATD